MEKPSRTNVLTSSTKSKKNLTFDFESAEVWPKYKPLSRYDFDLNIVEKWVELKCTNVPKRRSYHSSFIHKDTLYILGGLDLKEGKLSDISSVSLNFIDEIKWMNISATGDKPEAISDHSGALVDDNYYIFGGQNSKEEVTNNIHILDLNNFSWKKKTFSPKEIIPLSNHTCSYFQAQNTLVIFGGYSKGGYSNDIYLYKINENEWTKCNNDNSSKPEGRIKHTANIVGNNLYIYGGQNIDGVYLSDMWKFNLLEMKFEQINHADSSIDNIPNGKSGHTSIYNSKDNSLYIFGGKVGHAQERNELWKFEINEEKFKIIQDTLLEVEGDIKSIDTLKIKRSMYYFLLC